MASTGANATPGEIIAGRYRIEAWVGQGNMAMVFRATHLGTGRPCALKLVHAHLVERPEIREMFVQEARIGGRIGKNPYIVDVFDAGIDVNRGVPFLAMDLLEGTTLDKYIKQYGQMPPGLLKALWVQLADALEQAHAAGVVHRDLKPGNLFLTYDRKGNPQLRVVDFGIAKLMEEGVQRTATQIGTPAYAAPEQLGRGMRQIANRMGHTISVQISPMTDVWALGVFTYEMLIGARAGQLWGWTETETVPDLMLSVTTGPTPCASAQAGEKAHLLPPGFDAWVERCLQKNAADRWPGIELAVQHLVTLFDTFDANASTTSPSVDAATTAPLGVTEKTIPMNNIGAGLGPLPVTQIQTLRSAHEVLSPNPNSPYSTAELPIESTQQDKKIAQTMIPAPTATLLPDGTSLPISSTQPPARTTESRRLRMVIAGSIFGASALLLFTFTRSPAKAVVDRVPDDDGPVMLIADPIVSSTPPPIPPPPPPPPPPSTAESSPPPPPPSPPPTTQVSSERTVLSINSTPVSFILLDGVGIGQTPKIGIPIAHGEHNVVAIHLDSKRRKHFRFVLKRGERKTLAIKFE